MKNIMILERGELEILKRGDTIMLNLPNGEALELGLDVGRKRKDADIAEERLADKTDKVITSAQMNGRLGSGATNRILMVLAKYPNRFFRVKEITEKLGLQPQTTYLESLAKKGLIVRKDMGEKFQGDRPILVHKVTAKGLKYAKTL